jgi:hypothetical protein
MERPPKHKKHETSVTLGLNVLHKSTAEGCFKKFAVQKISKKPGTALNKFF